MNANFEPWIKYPPLTRVHLSELANMIRRARHETLLLHDPAAGDNEWSLGCRVYARTCHALRQAAKECEWLTILREDEKPLRFTFAIGSIPVRFYRGEAGDPPGNYLAVTHAELYQQQLAFVIDGIRLVDQILRLAIETDETREVSKVILVEMDTLGTVTEAYRIPFDTEAGNVAPLRSKPVDLPPPPVEPLNKEDKREKYKDRHVGSQ